MAYCGSDTTWATVDDLYSRYGDEFIDKLAIRRIWDVDLESYVADESPEGILAVVMLALCDAKQLLLQKLSCAFGNLYLLDESTFPGVKQFHMKLAIAILKLGGDCSGCNCEEVDAYLKCGMICNDDGVCLPSNSTFFSVSEAVFCCELRGDGCCCR